VNERRLFECSRHDCNREDDVLRIIGIQIVTVALFACGEGETPTSSFVIRSDVARATVTAGCVLDRHFCYGAPVHLGSHVNTAAFEGGPSLSGDGLELYFVSARAGALGGVGDQDIYVSRRRSIQDEWGVAVRVPPPISSPFFDITPSLSRDGSTLYFASNRPGPFSPPLPDLWVSRRASRNAPWGEATNLGPNVNTPSFEGSISTADHELTAYFAAMTPDFVFKIYTSTRRSTDEPFGPRTLVGAPINSAGHAYGPALTADGMTMFFAAGADNPFVPGAINHLYVSERKSPNATWGAPIYLTSVNCPTCFGGLPTISASGRTLCWMGDRGDSYGDKDIYCAERR
jgi:hypothetical protein